jgi:hypothetical protein
MTDTAKRQAGILLKYWRFEMTNENLQPNVGQMLRMTGNNTAQFMEQVAVHLEKMEAEVVRLTARVYELEAGQDDFK